MDFVRLEKLYKDFELEVNQILNKDEVTLKPYENGQVFRGFVLRRKLKVHGDLGFPICKETSHNSMGVTEAYESPLIDSVTQNTTSCICYVKLNRSAVMKRAFLTAKSSETSGSILETDNQQLDNDCKCELNKSSATGNYATDNDEKLRLLNEKESEEKSITNSNLNDNRNADLTYLSTQQNRSESIESTLAKNHSESIGPTLAKNHSGILVHTGEEDMKNIETMRSIMATQFAQKLCSNKVNAACLIESKTSSYKRIPITEALLKDIMNNSDSAVNKKPQEPTGSLQIEPTDREIQLHRDELVARLTNSGFACTENEGCVYIDAAKFNELAENKGANTFDGLIEVSKEKVSSKIVNLAACLQNKPTLHLLSTRTKHKFEQAAVLFQIAGTELKHQNMSVTQKTNETIDQWKEAREKELWESYTLKYGKIVNGEQWRRIIQEVSLASIKLDLLSTSLSSKISLAKTDSRNSVFILYNYSRLHKLQENFNQMLDQGVYKRLMDVSKIDFSSLNLQTEWDLFLTCFIEYPTLLSNVRSSILKGKAPSANQICQFISSLARDFSSYYHQTKVLLNARDHLMELMSARLHLMLAIKQVLEECFALLGVVPPKQM